MLFVTDLHSRPISLNIVTQASTPDLNAGQRFVVANIYAQQLNNVKCQNPLRCSKILKETNGYAI